MNEHSNELSTEEDLSNSESCSLVGKTANEVKSSISQGLREVIERFKNEGILPMEKVEAVVEARNDLDYENGVNMGNLVFECVPATDEEDLFEMYTSEFLDIASFLNNAVNNSNNDLEDTDTTIIEYIKDEDVSIETARSVKRVMEKGIAIGSESGKGTLRRQLDSLSKFPFMKVNECFADFNQLEASLNESIFYNKVAIKKLIRAFKPSVSGITRKGNCVILLGPPKSGKTTIIENFCKLANQSYEEYDCGGISDALNLDASSYKYSNGNTSKIIDLIIDSGVKNPFIIFDNIDKMSTSFRDGNPFNVLRKWIGKNNNKFVDDFLCVPLDISRVNFVFTVEDLDSVPIAIKNSCTVIELHKCDLDEKIEITNKVLVKKIIRDNFLYKDRVIFTRDAIKAIIQEKAFLPGFDVLINIINDIVIKEGEKELDNFGQFTVTKEYIKSYFDESLSKEILSLTDSKFEVFRELAKRLPSYSRKEQKAILEKAKGFTYELCGEDERYFSLLSKYPRGINTSNDITAEKMNELLKEYHGASDVKKELRRLFATNKLNGKQSGIIIGLIGNPGVGKTNFAQFAAKILNRNYTAINMNNLVRPFELTGIEGEKIGKIAQAFIDANSENPLILLDELEKASTDVQNALLAFLDPLQNKILTDEYLKINIPIDKAIIIATVNEPSLLSAPVMDRLDIFFMEDYSAQDKVEIAKSGKIEEYEEAIGLKKGSIRFSDETLRHIAKGYGFGFGFRKMQDSLKTIIAECAVEVIENNLDVETYSKEMTVEYVDKCLNGPFLPIKKVSLENKVGSVKGLATNSFFGSVLEIEAIAYKGFGQFLPTGSLGNVMQESAYVAKAVVRKMLADNNMGYEMSKLDINIHAAEGAKKKDGPSAGITIAVALFSAITGRMIKGDIAMTGEINLQGDVLPVGGVELKLDAAIEAGLDKIILPLGNKEDVDKIKNCDIDKSKIIYVSTISEVFNIALLANTKKEDELKKAC